MAAYVIMPGIDGSDDEHWQSRWEDQWGPAAVRTAPASWSAPDLADWIAAVQAAHARAAEYDGRVTLVAHSLGCWAAAEWLDRARPEGVTAFLVAPPDPRGPEFPTGAATFGHLTARPLPCPGLVVASDDDPYCAPGRAAAFASAWQAPFHLLAGHGHINSASGLGDWPAGRELLGTLTDR
ncbi:RBBP9/YdeN family alpha/beta hydrolase [Streptomyces sp. NPDC059740]|uniref:RBBP9/YdeN family alpha/beta hydrolase n=1 Tax=Streptomyces sp. NPDC059740 TaxID=3346926 RepID=UPI0036515141